MAVRFASPSKAGHHRATLPEPVVLNKTSPERDGVPSGSLEETASMAGTPPDRHDTGSAQSRTQPDRLLPILALTIDAPDGPRRRHCARQFAAIAMPFFFIEGVGKDSPEARRHYSRGRNLLLHKRGLTGGEIATYHGHRLAWQALVDSGAPVGLVVEDDLAILDRDAFRHVLRHAGDFDGWDILKLFDFQSKDIVAARNWHGLAVADYKYPSSGNVAYLLTRKTALRLLRRRKFFRPVDEDFSHPWEFGIRVRSLVPNIVAEVSHQLGGSHLEAERQANRQRRNAARSLWGIVLQAVKQLRAFGHRRHTA